MKRLFTIVMISLLTLSVWAVPARRIFTMHTQPDGTQIKLALVGDEHFHFLISEDGTAMQLDGETGFYVPIADDVLAEKRQLATERRSRNNQRRAARAQARREALAAGSTKDVGERYNITGKKKGLVILVEFSDKKLVSTQSKFNDIFNKEGYNSNNHIGSVRDYFLEQSYGKLDIEFDVVGPVSLTKACTYYGKDKNTQETDIHAHEMVIEACKSVDSEVNFADYDWDGDGEVDQVFIVFAGYGAHYDGANANWIWPAEWTLESACYFYPVTDGYPLKLDGTSINTYAYAPECAYTSGSDLNGIGTACHEFSHCLGLPDTYDAEYNLCPSMFDWDLMDSGSYNGPNSLGEVPSGLTAYERWTAGWLDFTELRESTAITDVPNLGDEARAYIIYNAGNRNEAYIMENRQNTRWFTYPKQAHGLLIYHVDYDATVWFNNELNTTPSHPRMCIVPASNNYGDKYEDYGVYSPSASQLKGHPWPGASGNKAFTDSSSPAATLFNVNSDGTKQLGVPIESITEKNGKISFLVAGGNPLDTPALSIASGSAEEGKVVLSWNAVSGATSYDLYMSAKTSAGGGSTEVLDEPMAGGMYSATTDSRDVSGELDSYMNNYGWTGARVYKSPNGAKLGSSKSAGYLQTPALEVEGDLSFTALFTRYGTDVATGTLTLVDKSGKTISSAKFTATDQPQTIELSGATNPCYIKIQPSKRMYVKGVKIEASAAGSHVERTVEGIKETLYEVGIEDGYLYTFRVRAVSDTGSSPWSEAVQEGEAEAIEQIEMTSETGLSFDLYGRPVAGDYKGLVIGQGKIVLRK